jgi:predicted nucleic acid-binding protein
MIDVLVADTCSFVNFAVVHRVDLLQDLYGGRITCAEAVRREVVDLTATMPELASLFASSWFDDPITFTDGADIAAIERLRRTVLGGDAGFAFPTRTTGCARRRGHGCRGPRS